MADWNGESQTKIIKSGQKFGWEMLSVTLPPPPLHDRNLRDVSYQANSRKLACRITCIRLSERHWRKEMYPQGMEESGSQGNRQTTNRYHLFIPLKKSAVLDWCRYNVNGKVLVKRNIYFGCLPLTQKFRKFGTECKRKDNFFFFPNGNFRGKTGFLER